MRGRERAIHLHALRAQDRPALRRERVGGQRREASPHVEAAQVGADRGVHLAASRQREAPEILVFDVGEQLGRRPVGMQVLPREHRARVREVEHHLVSVA
jgi:hypothetical protein